jgi:ribosomal protein S18 acetylase RimI-like enzyme
MTQRRREDEPAEIAIELVLVDAGREPVLAALYAAIRSDELGMEAWDPVVRQEVLRIQHEAQWRGYREQFPHAQTQLILRDGSAVGWVTIDRSGDALHGVDIALLPAQRDRGIGTQLLRALQAEAASGGRPMRFSVNRFNHRALDLYRRVGFSVIRETDAHIFMEWKA